MKSLQDYLNTYASQHTKKEVLLTHYVGIPAVLFAVLMACNWISIDIATKWQISFSWLAAIALVVYYFKLNVRLAIISAAILFVFTWFATLFAGKMPGTFSTILFLILFIGGWIAQMVGHLQEKTKPSFTQDPIYLLIGPLFVIVELLDILKIKKYFL